MKNLRNLTVALLLLIFVQGVLAQNFQSNVQPQAAYYQQFTCSQPKQSRTTTFLNILGSVLSSAQGISSRRGFNNTMQMGFTVVSAIQAGKTNGGILVCFVPVPTSNYQIP